MEEDGRSKMISNTLDRFLMALAVCVGAAICYVSVITGLILGGILVLGMIFSIITGKSTGLKISYVFVRTLAQAGFVVCALVSIFVLVKLDRADEVEILGSMPTPVGSMSAVFAFLSVCFILSAVALKYLWFEPSSRQLYVLHNLVMSERRLGARRHVIMSRGSLRSYSAVDELGKWAKLHQEGAISDLEFEAVRQKLLNLVE